MKPKSRVLIVDDHPFIREGLRFYLRDIDEFEVVGEAADGQQAVDQAVALKPDIVTMDLHLPIFDGLEATRRLRELVPTAAVLLLTVETKDDLITKAQAAGAWGWIRKDSSPAEFIHALALIRLGKPQGQTPPANTSPPTSAVG